MMSSQKQNIKIAHSPDTDDIFMFTALTENWISYPEYEFEITSADIETLNQKAQSEIYDVTALSVHAYAHLSDKYALTSSGASMAEKNWGPLLVAKEELTLSDLKDKKIAIPGEWTTAFLLLKLMTDFPLQTVSYDPLDILPAIENGEVDAGLLIHEGQIQYKDFGFSVVAAVLDYWKDIAGELPLPLGVSAVKKSLPENLKKDLARIQKESILYGMENFEKTRDSVLEKQPALSRADADKYLSWYVNDRTLDLNTEERQAIDLLFATAFEKGHLKNKVEVEIY